MEKILENPSSQRLVIISNRLPIVVKKENDILTVGQGSGGLITALAPVLKRQRGMWIGWPGTVGLSEEEIFPLVEKIQDSIGFSLHSLLLSQEEVDLYYHGFSNEIIWPLFHDLQSHCNFVPSYWEAYQSVNKKFAKAVAQKVSDHDFIWAHDYHLLLLGQELRKLGLKSKLAFFLHIPFPPIDIFLKLPWRFQILRALLEFDFIGFQTMRDKRNFVHCVRTLVKDISLESKGALHIYKRGEGEGGIGAFPISIDYQEFARLASHKEITTEAQHIRKTLSEQKIVFCLDRLDYTKGIPYRLHAIKSLLQKHPELYKRVTFVQVVVPSRTHIPEYQELKEEIDRLVGTINSQFTQEGWVPIHYMFRSLTSKELLAHYRASDVALITPIKDGMNLVAKEYLACNIEENGVLILSEFAGVASQLHDDALLVNPYDIEGLAEAIYRALTMPLEERRQRVRKMRKCVKQHDIFWWVRSLLHAAVSKKLTDFPPPQEYLPTGESVHNLETADLID